MQHSVYNSRKLNFDCDSLSQLPHNFIMIASDYVMPSSDEVQLQVDCHSNRSDVYWTVEANSGSGEILIDYQCSNDTQVYILIGYGVVTRFMLACSFVNS